MRREAERNTSHQMYEVGDQRRIVCEMSVEMIDSFSGVLLLQFQEVGQVNSLEKTIPAAAGGIALVNATLRREINQTTKISFEIQPGDLSVLVEHLPQRSRLYVFLQIMNRSLNLVYLPLNNLVMRVGQGKNPDRYGDPLQGEDLVQNKGL